MKNALQQIFLRSEYNYDTNEASDASGLKCKDQTRTQQAGAQECDINYIVKRYLVTGEMPQHQLPPLDADFAETKDLRESLDLINEARHAFEGLDAPIRSRFHNDPVAWVEFMGKPENADEIRKMGLWNADALAAWDTKDKAAKAAHAAIEADAKAFREGKTKGGDTKPVT